MRTFNTFLTAALVLASLSCSSDWEEDLSFAWGSASFMSTEVHSVGIIGVGQEGWATGELYGFGSGDLFFDSPQGVALDGGGNIYVTDYWNHRVCKWDSSGFFQGWIGGGSDGWQAGGSPSSGMDARSFNNPSCVAVNQTGEIFVTDLQNRRVCKWSSTGNFMGWIGGGLVGWQTANVSASSGNGLAEFGAAHGICLDSAGNIYVCDQSNHRVCKWSSSGVPLGWIGGIFAGWQVGWGTTSSSSWDGFNSPSGVWVDRMGDIYVADTYNHRVSRWNRYGHPQGWIGQGMDGWQGGSGVVSGNAVQYFDNLHNLCVDGQGNIYVADTDNSRISKWDHQGNAQGRIGEGSVGWSMDPSMGGWTNSAGFNYTMDVALDGSGGIFVADQDNHRISKWQQGSTAPGGPDTEAPAPILDLSATTGTGWGDVNLTWTAPPEDSAGGGRGYRYELRYSTTSMATDPEFLLAWKTHITDLPDSPGTQSFFGVSGLEPNNMYYFRLKTWDEAGNLSVMSNETSAVASGAGGSPDTVAPSSITDLSGMPGSMPGEIDLIWTARGDDGPATGTVSGYLIHVSLSPLVTPQDLDQALLYPASWAYMPAGNQEYLALTLAPNTTYYVTLRSYDEVFNVSGPAVPVTVISAP